MKLQELIDKLESMKQFFGGNADVSIQIDGNYYNCLYTSVDEVQVNGQNEILIYGNIG